MTSKRHTPSIQFNLVNKDFGVYFIHTFTFGIFKTRGCRTEGSNTLMTLMKSLASPSSEVQSHIGAHCQKNSAHLHMTNSSAVLDCNKHVNKNKCIPNLRKMQTIILTIRSFNSPDSFPDGQIRFLKKSYFLALLE